MGTNLYGAIEAGGTKFVCGIGTGPHDLRTAQFPTTTPAETLSHVVQYFKDQTGVMLSAIGIGSFGPVDLHPTSATFGSITSTPKPGWQNVDLAGAVRQSFPIPIGFDTDVAASALGEARWGAAQGLSDFLYLTVGTGIGGAAIVHGNVLHGLIHSEMGHIRIPHDLSTDPYRGHCPFHYDCLEGLAAGPSIKARWGKPAQDLPGDHPAWKLEAHYLAEAIVNFILILSPQRILVGGGVMQQPQIFPLIRNEVARLLNGYVQHEEILSHLDRYIAPPQLGGLAGVLGALVLAEQAQVANQARARAI
jgi:fructokinase